MERPAPVQLAFYRDAQSLPGPLPHLAEILNASGAGPSDGERWDRGGVCVVRDIYVVKYGVTVPENEGNALLFLEKCLNIPAPRLHAMYRIPPDDAVCLVMDNLPGVTLETIWDDLPTQAKLSIASQLGDVFADIRSLSPPSDFIGGVSGGPLPYRFFWNREGDPKITGPFKTQEEVGRALGLRSKSNWEHNNRHGWTSDFFLRHLPKALSGHAIKFTHGDIHPGNILVQEVEAGSGSHGGKQYRISGLVDWETAGWYPAYWEYVGGVVSYLWDSDWLEMLEKIIEPFPLEAAMMAMVRQDLEY